MFCKQCLAGNLNFLAHGKKSNKLRIIKVVDTEPTDESDISSIESITESLKSEDVFAGNGNEDDTDDEETLQKTCKFTL